MSFLSKILESTSKHIAKELDKQAQKQIHKEQRGIYNVTYNGKNATYIHLQDEQAKALRLAKGDKNKGGTHIRLEHSTDSTLGLKFRASLALTHPLNLPALGRRQPLYIILRFCRDLCFW